MKNEKINEKRYPGENKKIEKIFIFGLKMMFEKVADDVEQGEDDNENVNQGNGNIVDIKPKKLAKEKGGNQANGN